MYHMDDDVKINNFVSSTKVSKSILPISSSIVLFIQGTRQFLNLFFKVLAQFIRYFLIS